MKAVDELCDEVNAVVIGDASTPICDGQENANRILARSIPICDGQENANRILARSIPICDGQENANQILARTIMDGRRKISTRKNYDKKITVFQLWLVDNYETHINKSDGSIILPLPSLIISEFMAKISVVIDKKTKASRPAAVSQVGSYTSALAWLHEKEHLKNDETSLTFANFAGGYKRSVATMKLKGEIKLKEGMSPITFV